MVTNPDETSQLWVADRYRLCGESSLLTRITNMKSNTKHELKTITNKISSVHSSLASSYLAVVRELVCPRDPKSYVGGGREGRGKHPKPARSEGRGQTLLP